MSSTVNLTEKALTGLPRGLSPVKLTAWTGHRSPPQTYTYLGLFLGCSLPAVDRFADHYDNI